MFNAILKKEGDKLIYRIDADNVLYKEFCSHLEDGQLVEIFLDANKDDGTLAQLAKVHKCIRELAKDAGYTFEDMKLEIKKASGLCIYKNVGGEDYMICKSFGDASKEELGMVLQTIIDRGDFCGMNFR